MLAGRELNAITVCHARAAYGHALSFRSKALRSAANSAGAAMFLRAN